MFNVVYTRALPQNGTFVGHKKKAIPLGTICPLSGVVNVSSGYKNDNGDPQLIVGRSIHELGWVQIRMRTFVTYYNYLLSSDCFHKLFHKLFIDRFG